MMLNYPTSIFLAASSAARLQSGGNATAGLSLDTVVTAIGIVVGLILWWTRTKKIELEGIRKAIVSLLDLGSLVVTVILLRVWGVVLFVVVSVIATLVVSMRMAANQQSILTSAAINSRDSVTRADIETLHHRLRKQDDGIRVIGPIAEARLLLFLAQRSRSLAEIEAMAPVVARLWYMHKGDLSSLVERFDRLLRLYGKKAPQSVEAANELTAATKQIVGTFDEVLDSLIVAGGGTLLREAKSTNEEA